MLVSEWKIFRYNLKNANRHESSHDYIVSGKPGWLCMANKNDRCIFSPDDRKREQQQQQYQPILETLIRGNLEKWYLPPRDLCRVLRRS